MSAESQRRLRAAAVELFAERGYRETSLQDIGLAAGISRGSITWHFGSKAGLLDAIVSDMIDKTIAALEAVPDDDTTPLPAWLELYRHFIETDPEAKVLPMLLLESLGPRSEIREHYAAFHQRVRDWVRNRFALAQKRGEIAPGYDPAALAAVIWAALVGAHVQWRLDQTLDLGAVTKTLAGLFQPGYDS